MILLYVSFCLLISFSSNNVFVLYRRGGSGSGGSNSSTISSRGYGKREDTPLGSKRGSISIGMGDDGSPTMSLADDSPSEDSQA